MAFLLRPHNIPFTFNVPDVMQCRINWHLFRILLSTSLIRKRGHSLSHIVHAEVQSHQQPWCNCEKLFLLLSGVMWMAHFIILTHVLTFALVCACVWTYSKTDCIQFLSSASNIVFNASIGAATDYSQSAKDIDLYFNSQLYQKDLGHR